MATICLMQDGEALLVTKGNKIRVCRITLQDT